MIKRRQLLQISAGLLISQALGLRAEASASPTLRLIQRAIPSSGELLPVMGMGTSRTFDTEGDPASLATLQEVLQAFFDGGGTVIDSNRAWCRSSTTGQRPCTRPLPTGLPTMRLMSLRTRWVEPGMSTGTVAKENDKCCGGIR